MHGRTALASIQVDTSTIALFLCCKDKDTALLHDYHFILFATLYTQACCIYIQIQAEQFKPSFVHFENLNYALHEQYYSNKFSHNASIVTGLAVEYIQ